jgi:hypothetical protein
LIKYVAGWIGNFEHVARLCVPCVSYTSTDLCRVGIVMLSSIENNGVFRKMK